jgi:hypothetical protein
MSIQTVKSLDPGYGYLVNGNMGVPNDPGNRHYQEILDWINEGNTPTGPDVIEPDYVALRTGPTGYAPIHEQLAMQTDGTWDAHVADVKTRFPKSNTGSTTIGDVPQAILDAAAAKLAAQQLSAYTTAIARLAQYVLSVGRTEVTESQATGEQVFNEETMEMDDVMADVVTVTAIDALESTVEVTTYDFDTETSSTETVTNPLIVTDVSERTDAQDIVDATPSAVVDAYNAL